MDECKMTTEKNLEGRLFSLDVLRGLDMVLLTVLGPLVNAAQDGWKCFPAGFIGQFRHGWECFTLWDIIMPLFIFMCGAAIPYALGKRLEKGQGVFWRHVLARVALLWFLGGLVQGNWITLDPLKVTPFSNTLQSIAVGYLVVAAAMSLRSRALMFVLPIALAVGYTLLLAFLGDYSKFGNFANKVDHAILVATLPAQHARLVNPSYYTWYLTSAMFAVMTFAGYHSTMILRSGRTLWRKAAVLGGYGAALLAVGFLAEIWVPCIKPIYTLSFTAQAMGWCVLALCALYVLTDIWRLRRGLGFAIFFGQLALAAYFTSHFFRPVLTAFAHLIGDGLLQYLPKTSEPFVVCVLKIVGMLAMMVAWRAFKTCRREMK